MIRFIEMFLFSINDIYIHTLDKEKEESIEILISLWIYLFN